MVQPIHAPLQPAHDKVAALLTHLTGTPGEDLTLTTIAHRAIGGVAGYVIVHLADGRRIPLSLDEARAMARILRDGEDIDVRWERWADSLESAAETTAIQVSAMLLSVRGSHSLGVGRAFGGRR